MRERLLAAIGALGVERPRAVLAVALALTLGAAAGAPTLEISSSRFDLIAGESSFLEAEGARTDLVALVTAEDDARGRAAAEALATRLREARGVRGVFHRVAPSLFRDRALLYLSVDEARAVAAGAALDGLAAWVAAAREGLGARDRGETLDALDDAPDPADAEAGLAWLTRLLEEAEAWQRDPARTTLAVGARRRAPIDADGYLISGDGRTRFVLVTPAAVGDRYDEVAPVVRRARAIAREVERAHGVQVDFTGYPALAVDEVEAIRGGSLVTGVVSAVLVMALFALGFRSRGGAVVAGLPLGVGMLWAFGGIALTVGHLNLLTQAAAPVFAGLGIDFAVHLLSAYDASRREGTAHAAAIDGAMRGAGKAILTGCLTTAGAFAALAVTEHAAFRELGLIAGLGLCVVLAAVLFLTPALLTLGAERGWVLLMVGRGPAPTWTRPAEGRLVALVTGRPGTVLAALAALTAVLALGVPRLRFEANVEALLPADAPSVIAARRLRRDGAFSSEVLVTRAPDLATLRARTEALERRPTVGHVESLASFVPADAGAILEAVRATPAAAPPAPIAPLGQGLTGLAAEAEAVADDVAGVAGEAGPAAALRRLAVAARALADGLDEDRAAAFDAALRATLAPLRASVENARQGTLAPFDVEALPPQIRARLIDEGDGYPLYVHPRGDVFAPGVLDAFLRDVRGVAPDAAGSPADFAAFLASMTRSLQTAALVAVVVVVLLLGADLRRPREVLLALAPVTLGVVWLFGLLGWLGVPINMASLAAVPLILGIGVDDGVHLIHRRRVESTTAGALAAVLRALVLTTLTTLGGFGALGLAAHRGMQSFAVVMTIGATACLIGATVALPALMRVTSRE